MIIGEAAITLSEEEWLNVPLGFPEQEEFVFPISVLPEVNANFANRIQTLSWYLEELRMGKELSKDTRLVFGLRTDLATCTNALITVAAYRRRKWAEMGEELQGDDTTYTGPLDPVS